MTNEARSVGRSPTGQGRDDDATSRARRSGRFGLIYLMLFLGSALVAGCASARTESAGAVATPLGQVTNPPGPTAAQPTSRAFSSSRYGFDVALPSSWQTRPASAAWTSGELGESYPEDWDYFSDTTQGRTLAVAAMDVPQDTTLAAWQARMRAGAPAVVTDSDSSSETTIDGQRALKWTAVAASEGVNVIKLAALHGTRGYMLLLVSPKSTGLDADEAVFDAIMDTFRFTGP